MLSTPFVGFPGTAYSTHFNPMTSFLYYKNVDRMRRIWLVISVYLSSLPVVHLRPLVVSGDSARIQDELLRTSPGSLTCSAYSTVTWDLGLRSHPKDNS